MKVLQVINNLGVGGAEVLLKDLVVNLLQHEIDVSIALLNSTSSHLELDLQSMGVCFLPNIKDSLYSPRHIFWLAHKLKKYDIIHVHLFPAQLWVAIASYISNKKPILITTEHNTYNQRRKAWFRPIDRWMYNAYRVIACVSDATASALIQWIPESKGKVTVIPNGINLERFRNAKSACRNEILLDESRPVILFTGRLEPQKDHITVFRAIVKIPDAQLILVGDGERRHYLEQLAIDLGISNRVYFLGQRQDIPELIKMADIYVQSSHWEGFGIAVLEAMAGGLPVIASNVPGLNNVVESAGILFPPGDSDALAIAISSLLSSRELRNKLSQAGIKRARIFSIDQTVDLYLNLYQKAYNDSIA